jgi:hypothetical protein
MKCSTTFASERIEINLNFWRRRLLKIKFEMMVSKQQDICSEISTGECSTVNSFGFAEKLLRYIEQEEVFSH